MEGPILTDFFFWLQFFRERVGGGDTFSLTFERDGVQITTLPKQKIVGFTQSSFDVVTNSMSIAKSQGFCALGISFPWSCLPLFLGPLRGGEDGCDGGSFIFLSSIGCVHSLATACGLAKLDVVALVETEAFRFFHHPECNWEFWMQACGDRVLSSALTQLTTFIDHPNRMSRGF